MSAYATSFFLPPASCPVTFGGKGDAGTSTGTSSTDTSRDSSSSGVGPLHMMESTGNGSGSGSIGKRVPDIFITVKSASVDPAGFVRAITARGSSRRQPRGGRAASISEGNDGSDARSDSSSNISSEKLPPISPKSKPPLRARADSAETAASHDSKQCESSSALHDEAIQFELSIQYAGRRYAATRTLNRLVRLRSELVRELRDRTPGIPSVGGRGHGHGQVEDVSSNADDDTVTLSEHECSLSSSRNDRGREQQGALPLPPVIIIPELPVAGVDHGHADVQTLSSSSSSSSSSPSSSSRDRAHLSTRSGSFTRLHMALKSYCPAVENWFTRLVTDVLPDPESSPSLTAFLWEPLGSTSDEEKNGNSGELGGSINKNKRHGSSRSTCTLGSIEEQDDGNEDEDEGF